MLLSQNVKRLPETGLNDSTAYQLSVPASGWYTDLAAVKTDADKAMVYPMGAVGGEGGGTRRRALTLQFFGTGADDSQIKYKIYAAKASTSGQRYLEYLGEVTATLSAVVGAAGLPAETTSHRFADAITWTESAYYTALRTLLGVNAAMALSPGSNAGPATLMLEDVGPCSEIIIDVDLQTNATGAGVLIEGWT